MKQLFTTWTRASLAGIAWKALLFFHFTSPVLHKDHGKRLKEWWPSRFTVFIPFTTHTKRKKDSESTKDYWLLGTQRILIKSENKARRDFLGHELSHAQGMTDKKTTKWRGTKKWNHIYSPHSIPSELDSLSPKNDSGGANFTPFH